MFFLDRPLVATSGVDGDFNNNSELDAEDIVLLAKELRSDCNVELFDVNSDNIENFLDRNFWVSDLANTFFGGYIPGSTSVQELIAACSGSLITDRHILTAARGADSEYTGEVDFLVRTFPYVMGFELPDRDLMIQVNTDTIQLAPGWPDNEFADLAVMELLEDAPIAIPRYPL